MITGRASLIHHIFIIIFISTGRLSYHWVWLPICCLPGLFMLSFHSLTNLFRQIPCDLDWSNLFRIFISTHSDIFKSVFCIEFLSFFVARIINLFFLSKNNEHLILRLLNIFLEGNLKLPSLKVVRLAFLIEYLIEN